MVLIWIHNLWRQTCILVLLLVSGTTLVAGQSHSCFKETLPAFPRSHVIWCEDGRYAIYECGHKQVTESNNHNIAWCDNVTREWTIIGDVTCDGIQNPCEPNPCMNYGMCSTWDDPDGWRFACQCQGDVGGKFCHILYPCSVNKCPVGTRHCVGSSSHDLGRRCYDYQWNEIY